ncbi:Sensor protein KdpD [bacterium HR29]|jgi:signal transduction histidine kinase|nr:Sensor protein KdpD [bacterium HR29]
MRWAGELLAIALLLGAAIGAPLAAVHIADSAEEQTYEAERMLARAHQALALAADARASALAYLLSGGPGLRAEYEAATAAAREEFAHLQDREPAAEEVGQAFERWVREGPAILIAMAEAGNREGAAALAQTGRSAELFSAFGEAGEELVARLERHVESRRDAQLRATVGAFVLFGLGMVALAATLALAARTLATMRRVRQAARESRELALAASRLAEERRELLGAATNELRGPLTALALAADMLSRDLPASGDPSLAPLAQEIARSVRRLTSLVEDLLDYAALETDGLTLVREEADLRAIAEAAVTEVRAVRSEVTPVIETTGGDATVFGDVPRLRRALAAFVGGLVRRGSVPARLSISSEGTELACTIEGPPPASDLPPGPNISTEVARRIVALHGGSVLEEAPGRVVIRLPRTSSVSEASGAAKSGA